MNLTISGHHLDVTPAIREYVLAKLDRITRHFDQVVDITVLLSIEKPAEKERRQKAEVTVHVKGKDIFAECTSEDLYAAIDQLMDKLDRQVVRHKDKVQNHHHDAAQADRRHPQLSAAARCCGCAAAPRRRPSTGPDETLRASGADSIIHRIVVTPAGADRHRRPARPS